MLRYGLNQIVEGKVAGKFVIVGKKIAKYSPTGKDAMYMNPVTGSVDTYDGWWYEDENGEKRNAVDRNEVVAVIKDKDGTWKEV